MMHNPRWLLAQQTSVLFQARFEERITMGNPKTPGAGQAQNSPPQAASQPLSQHQPVQVTQPDASAPFLARRSESWVETATNAGIVPAPADGNDPSITADWRPVELAPNRSCSCEVAGTSGHVLTARIEQPPYDRTLRGQGTLKIPVIPAAAIGTKGKLSVQDEANGAQAEYLWEWKPIKHAKWVAPPRTAPPGARTKQTESRQTWNPKSASSKSFFGVPLGAADAAAAAAAPSRYAFILDMSGSMVLSGKRWQTCVQQLTSALEALPATAKVFVILFSTTQAMPPGQEEWMAAEPEWKKSVLEWLASVTPNGGTLPGPAFERVFSLAERPEMIFFLTDGLCTDVTAASLKKLSEAGSPSNSGGFFKKAARSLFGGKDDAGASPTINTVTLEDASGAKSCQEIADAFGGLYVHAKTGTE
jgi:hypothetical protein